MWFDLQFTLYTVCCLTFQLHSQNYIVATSVIEQLTLSILTKILLKCRFSLLFSFTVSITLLYVSHWPQLRVCHYKVFQLSIQYAHWDSILEFPIPRNNTKVVDFLTALLWNCPMVCYLYHFRDGWFVVILSHRYVRFKVSGLKSSYYKPFFTLFVLNVYHNIIYKLNYTFIYFIQHVNVLFERTYIHSDYSKLLVFRFQVQR